MPQFSIVVTCHNQRGMIEQAVASALAQEQAAGEVIVVDDASTDGSMEALAPVAGSVRVERLSHNQGANVARNRGASLSGGDYIVFLDGDDLLAPWSLRTLACVVERWRPAVILARLSFFSTSAPYAWPGAPAQLRCVEYESYLHKDRSFHASASSIVVSRAAFDSSGGWTPGMFPMSDQDFLLKLGAAGCAVQITDPPTAAYRKHTTNVTLQIPRLVEFSHRLLRREREGVYPGGAANRSRRRAILGGAVFFQAKRARRVGHYRACLGLLADGAPFIASAILRRWLTKLGGTKPEHTIRMSSPPVGVGT